MAWWSANAHHDDVLSCPLNDADEYDNRSDDVVVLVDRYMFLKYT